MTPRHDILPRIAKYTPSLVSELVSYDRRSNGTHKSLHYGRSKVCSSSVAVYHCFLVTVCEYSEIELPLQLRPREEVVYSRSVTAVSNQSPSREKYHHPQMSIGSNMKVHNSIILSEEQTDQTKVMSKFFDSCLSFYFCCLRFLTN